MVTIATISASCEIHKIDFTHKWWLPRENISALYIKNKNKKILLATKQTGIIYLNHYHVPFIIQYLNFSVVIYSHHFSDMKVLTEVLNLFFSMEETFWHTIYIS